jgi:hypothetical protein
MLSRYVAAYQIEHVSSKYARPPSYLSIARQVLQSSDVMQKVSSVMSVIAYEVRPRDGGRTQDPSEMQCRTTKMRWSIASAFRPVASVACWEAREKEVVSIVVCHNSGPLHSQTMINFPGSARLSLCWLQTDKSSNILYCTAKQRRIASEGRPWKVMSNGWGPSK